jgi:DNA-directed RNA polymerase II subunit RPB1
VVIPIYKILMERAPDDQERHLSIADRGTMVFVTQTIAQREAHVTVQIIEDTSHDQLKANLDKTVRGSLESRVQLELSLARDACSRFAQKNWKRTIASSGWWWSGPMSIWSRRIPFGFRHRTLPQFAKDDFSP